MENSTPPARPPVIASGPSSSLPWYSLHVSPNTWVPVAIGFAAPVCCLVVGYLVSGSGIMALFDVLLLGIIAAAGVTSAVTGLIRARRAQDRLLVVFAAIALALNSPFFAWAVRALGIAATLALQRQLR